MNTILPPPNVTKLSASGGGIGTCACRMGAVESTRDASAGIWLAPLFGILAFLRIRRRDSGKNKTR
jgi:hypothetical protein